MQKRPLYWSGILVLLVVAAIVAGNFLLTKGIATHAQSPATSTPVTLQLTGTTTHIPTSHASLPQQSYQAQKSTSGIFKRYALKDITVVGGITKGQDGNLWFTEINARKIGRITTSGWVTTFQLPAPIIPYPITTAGDGSLWFLYDNHITVVSQLARMTTSGNLTTFQIPQNISPASMTKGPDGAIWFNTDEHTIARIAQNGTLTQFTVGQSTTSITTGSDGALWFIVQDQNIGRLTTGGKYTVYTVPGAVLMSMVTAGPGNAVWFIDELASHGIGKITPAGQITTYTAAGIDYQNVKFSDAKNGGLVFTLSAVRSFTHAQVIFYTPGGTPKTVDLAATGTDIGPAVATSSGVLWMPDDHYIDTFTFQR